MKHDRSHSLSFRSYGLQGRPHSHAHAQIVLPVQGELDIEVGGRGGRLDLSQGAFIAPGTRHCQAAEGANRFLILECEGVQIGDESLERLSKQSFLTISDAARRLIQFIELSTQAGEISSAISVHSFPLLIQALINAPTGNTSRLSALLRRVENTVGEDWPVSRMAQVSALSPSRLHALFQSELATTPQNWLSETRLRHAQELLANSNLPISQLAHQLGYSDQTALTRAMRRMTKITPAAYRRLHRQ
jgi:AraC-type DNA-binding domain-containing proteins